jgi:hypothetical protein
MMAPAGQHPRRLVIGLAGLSTEAHPHDQALVALFCMPLLTPHGFHSRFIRPQVRCLLILGTAKRVQTAGRRKAGCFLFIIIATFARPIVNMG